MMGWYPRSRLLPLLFLALAVPASATVVVEGSDAFKAKVKACLDHIRSDGAEAKKILEDLEKSDRETKIQAGNKSNSTTSASDEDGKSKDAGGTGKGTNSTVTWDPEYKDKYADGTPRDPCASLLHELRHALDGVTGTRDPRPDPGSKIPMNEVKACTEENRYRKDRGLPQRTQYGDKKLPASAMF